MDNIKYLGVTISKDLKWITHVSNACTKGNRTLGVTRITEIPEYYRNTGIPVKNIGIPVKDTY